MPAAVYVRGRVLSSCTGQRGTTQAQDIDFREIFRISPTGMAVLTADITFADVSDQFLAEAGRQLEELTGRFCWRECPAVIVMPDGYDDVDPVLVEADRVHPEHWPT